MRNLSLTSSKSKEISHKVLKTFCLIINHELVTGNSFAWDDAPFILALCGGGLGDVYLFVIKDSHQTTLDGSNFMTVFVICLTYQPPDSIEFQWLLSNIDGFHYFAIQFYNRVLFKMHSASFTQYLAC